MTNFFKLSFTLIILSVFAYILLPFMLSIVLGGILAMAISPFVEFFILRGVSRKVSLMILTLLLAITGIIPIIAFFIRGSKIIAETLHQENFVSFNQDLTQASFRLIEKVSDLYGVDPVLARTQVSNFLTFLGKYLLQTLNQFISQLPLTFMIGAVTTLSLYFFLSQSDEIRRFFNKYFYLDEQTGNQFIHKLKVCCRQVFLTNIFTGLLQATIVSIGAYFFKAGDFFIVFFITFVFSFIPIIGAGPVAVVAALSAFMAGRTGAAAGMLVVALVTSVSDNIIKPYLGSRGEVDVHPFIGLLAVIGGVMSFGFPGLFIGPMVAAIYFGVLPIILETYFPRTEAEKKDVPLKA